MKKKIFAGMVAAAMAMGSLTLPETISMDGIGAIPAQAAEVVDSGTWWTLDDEGTLTISDTPPVMCWFGEYSDIITMVVIEDGVTGIVAEMFESCYNMTSITISDSVEFIGTWAFAGCSNLASIEIPAGVTEIYDWVFDGCTSLTNVTFLGDAPEFSVSALEGLTATAYYPASNSTWTEDVMQQYGGEITWVAYEADNSVGDANTESTYQCKINELTEVPSSLSEKYDSVESLKAAMIASVTADDRYVEENTAVYDIVLMISTDGGTTWQEATEEYFPEDGITVTLSYPEGTDSSYDFVVAHMFTETSESLGTVAGEVEYPAVTKTDDGIQVTLKGLSPVAISWALSSSADDAANNATISISDNNASNTGSNSGTNALWLLICLFASGFAVMAYTQKRRSTAY